LYRTRNLNDCCAVRTSLEVMSHLHLSPGHMISPNPTRFQTCLQSPTTVLQLSTPDSIQCVETMPGPRAARNHLVFDAIAMLSFYIQCTSGRRTLEPRTSMTFRARLTAVMYLCISLHDVKGSWILIVRTNDTAG